MQNVQVPYLRAPVCAWAFCYIDRTAEISILWNIQFLQMRRLIWYAYISNVIRFFPTLKCIVRTELFLRKPRKYTYLDKFS